MLRIFLYTICFFVSTNTFAQELSPEVIGTSGDSYQSDDIELSWTLGEVASASLMSENLWLTEGFHQVYTVEIYPNEPVVLPPIFPITDWNCYPNPAHDFVTIERTSTVPMRIELVNPLGQVIRAYPIDGPTATLNIERLSAGIYYIWIKDQQEQLLQKFKIIKYTP